jgi:hypothetical protein
VGYYYLAEIFYNKRKKLDKKDKTFIRTYRNMMQRCYNKNSGSYKYYGDRGISVCWRWHDFENFYKDMYKTFELGLSIDRINNEGNYEPNNCRWVTNKEQCYNRRSNRILSFDGLTMTLTEWAEKIGIDRDTITARLNAYNWSVEKALTTPVRERRK